MNFLKTCLLMVTLSLVALVGCGPVDAPAGAEEGAAAPASKDVLAGHDSALPQQGVRPSKGGKSFNELPAARVSSEGGQADQTIDDFHRLFYDSRESTWRDTYWMGVGILKNPLDLWAYQEIIHEVRPDFIVEAGTASGGSALFLANLLDLLGAGQVVTIDIEAPDRLSGIFSSNKAGSGVRPPHPRIHYLVGSSTDAEIYSQVKSMIPEGARVLVVLDSDHSRDHVLDEMNLYSKLVSLGSYLIVEDSNINGHPVLKDCYPGPMEAIEQFMTGRDDFAIDRGREKFLITFNPSGFLRRVR